MSDVLHRLGGAEAPALHAVRPPAHVYPYFRSQLFLQRTQAYRACVSELHRFRANHIKVATAYLIRTKKVFRALIILFQQTLFAAYAQGTGGSDFRQMLGEFMTATQQARACI